MLTTNLQQKPEESAQKQLLSQKNRDIAEKQRHIESIIAEIYQADDQEQSATLTKRDRIQKLAVEMEEIMLQEEQPEQINLICTLICNRFAKDGRASLKWWAIEVLDDKYKRKLDKSSIRSLGQPSDLPVECSVTEEMVLSELIKIRDKLDLFQLRTKGTQKIGEVIYDIEKKIEDHAHDNGFEVYNRHRIKSDLDYANEYADDEYDEKISEPSLPISLDAAIRLVDEEAYNETMACGDELKVWGQKQKEKYPSQTIEQATGWRDSIAAFRRMLKQFIDGKARRSMNQWGEINANMAEHGGTAASSKSAMPVTNPETGQPLIDPKTLQKVYRDITKEQIDARGPRYATEIDFMTRQWIVTDMMEARFKWLTCGIRDFRAYAARDKLSRKA